MKLNILGSGGALSLPRPLCFCKNCSLARVEGLVDVRTGPAMMVEDAAVLFDTPEEIRLQLEREHISRLTDVFYTHWHPDHTQGLRIFEHIKHVYKNTRQPINVYIPANDVESFHEHCAALWYYQRRGYIAIQTVEDRQSIGGIGELKITPIDFQCAEPGRIRYGYLIEEQHKRVLYAPCSIFGAVIDRFWQNLDCLIMETGWLGNTDHVRAELPADHAWQDHISFEECLVLARAVAAKLTIFTHIDGSRHLEPQWNHAGLSELVADVQETSIQIAHDGMRFCL